MLRHFSVRLLGPYSACSSCASETTSVCTDESPEPVDETDAAHHLGMHLGMTRQRLWLAQMSASQYLDTGTYTSPNTNYQRAQQRS